MSESITGALKAKIIEGIDGLEWESVGLALALFAIFGGSIALRFMGI